MEHYYTIQGEGYNTGKSAYFLRLGGCDVGCVWCDVKESWDASAHPMVEADQMLNWVRASGATRVVVTGGEPAMHDLRYLTGIFRNAGMDIFIETSGAYPLTGEWNWICVSPKKFKAPLEVVLALADELKVVVFNESDFLWAEAHAAKVKPFTKLFLQPEYSVLEKMIPKIIQYVKINPKWQISLQTHKVMNIP